MFKMPRKVQERPAEPQPEEPPMDVVESAPANPAPVKKQRGGDIHKARLLALQKLKERSEAKKREAELVKLKEENDRKMVEAELAKEKALGEALSKPVVVKKKTKAAPPPESESESDSETESDTESESEEERVVVKKTIYKKKAAPAKQPRQPKQAVAVQQPTPNDIMRAEYERRMQAVRANYMKDIFGV